MKKKYNPFSDNFDFVGDEITADLLVTGNGDVGGITEGSTVTAGTSFNDLMKTMLQSTVPPTYTIPEAGAILSPNGNVEIGTTTNITITPTFNQHDGGPFNNVVLKKDGTIITTQTTLTPYIHVSQIIGAGAITYSATISYDEGPIKDDNMGDPYPIGQIPAGTVVGESNIIGVYYNWYGAYGETPPVDGSDLRTLATTISNTFDLNTGTSAKSFVIGIPASKTLLSVFDGVTDLTANYPLSAITTVPDAAGNDVSYNVYILNVALPYSSNHVHKITLS